MLTARRIWPIVSTLAAACGLFVACSGSGGTTTVVRTLPPGEAATPVPVTGIIEIDRVVDAAERGDVIKLAELTLYSKLPCAKEPASPAKIGDPPACVGDEPDGTEVEALPVTICEGGWARPEQAVRSYRAALAGGPARVSSVYVPKDDLSAFEASLHEQYVAVLRIDDPSGAKDVALHITGGRIAWVEMACPAGANLAGPDRAQSFLLAPTPPPATPSTVEPEPTP
jgi:hypothetical protein